METTQKDRRQFWIGMGISTLCLIAIFIFIDPVEFIDAFRHANYFYLALSGFGILLFMIMRTFRWRYMLDHQISYGQVFHVQNIGYMLNMYLPFRLGDIARAVLMGNVPPITIAQSISTMVVERLLDVMFFVALLPFTLASVPSLPDQMRQAALGSGILAVIAILILIVAANQLPLCLRMVTYVLDRIPPLDTAKWVRRVEGMLQGLRSFTRLKDGIILVVLSILVWLPVIFAYHVAMTAVGLVPTVSLAAFVMCAAALSIAAPSSPGGVGVFQAGVIAALALVGQPEEPSAAFAFAYHGMNYLSMTILGLISLASTGSTISNVIQATQRYTKRQNRVGDELS